MDYEAGYETFQEAVKAGRKSDEAKYYAGYAIQRMMTGRFGIIGPDDEAITPTINGGGMVGGTVVARFDFRYHNGKWRWVKR
jgi:hypothetical protein